MKQKKWTFSRRKLLASLGLTSATVATGGLMYAFSEQHNKNPMGWDNELVNVIEEMNNIAALNGQKLSFSALGVTLTIPDIPSLLNLPSLLDGQTVKVNGYHPSSTIGGGNYMFQSTLPQVHHDGGAIIAIDAPFPSDWNNVEQLNSWFNYTGGANGCFVRLDHDSTPATAYGVKFNGMSETIAFQAFMDGPAKVKVVPLSLGTLCLGTINMPSHCVISFEAGEIIDDGTLAALGRQFNFTDCKNVKLYGNGTVIKQVTNYESGEQRHGVYIADNADNIHIYGITCQDAWGDGFYIGKSQRMAESPNNIYLTQVTSIGNRRQGISVTAANNLVVEKSKFLDTGKGAAGQTNPQCGLDIEPNFPTDLLTGIRFIDCEFTNSNRQGIVISLHAYSPSSVPADIKFIRPLATGNYFGVLLQGCKAGVGGLIEITNGLIMNNTANGIRHRNWSADGALVRVINTSTRYNNVSGSAGQQGGWYADVVVCIENSFSVGDTGNIEFIDCESISDPSENKVRRSYAGFIMSGYTPVIRNVYFRNCKSNAAIAKYWFPSTPNENIAVEYDDVRWATYDHTASATISPDGRSHTNKSATSAITLQLATSSHLGSVHVIEVAENMELQISAPSGAVIYPISESSVMADTIGSKLKLKLMPDGNYHIIEQIGEWVSV